MKASQWITGILAVALAISLGGNIYQGSVGRAEAPDDQSEDISTPASVRAQWALSNPTDALWQRHLEGLAREEGWETTELAENYATLWENEVRHAYTLAENAVNTGFTEFGLDIVRDKLTFFRQMRSQTEIDAMLLHSNAITEEKIADWSVPTAETGWDIYAAYGQALLYRERALDLYAILKERGVDVLFAAENMATDKKELLEGRWGDISLRELWDGQDMRDGYSVEDVPLLAELPEHDIQLYGLAFHGMALHVRNNSHFFPWANGMLTPRQVFPQMEVADYDGDGTDEIAVVLYVGSGTEYSVDELHIVEYGWDIWSDTGFTDHMLDACGVSALEGSNISARYDKARDMVILEGYGAHIETPARWRQSDGQDEPPKDIPYEVRRVGLEDIVRFSFEDGKIILKQVIGIYDTQYATPEFVAELRAEVVYADGTFSLENVTIGDLPG